MTWLEAAFKSKRATLPMKSKVTAGAKLLMMLHETQHNLFIKMGILGQHVGRHRHFV